MAITQDASTPAFSSTIGGTNLSNYWGTTGTRTQTSASFSPPTNSLVVILAAATYDSYGMNFSSTGLSCADSQSTSYGSSRVSLAANTGSGGAGVNGLAIFTHYYSSAPGSITVTVTLASAETSSSAYYDVDIYPVVLTGAASSQTGAATGTARPPSAAQEVTVVTTTVGSVVLVLQSSYVAPATALSNTTVLNGAMTATSDSFYAAISTVTGTPGSTTYGWTDASGQGGLVALEILPATGTTRPGTATLTGSGSMSAAWRLAASAALSGSGVMGGTAPTLPGAATYPSASLYPGTGVFTALVTSGTGAALSGSGTMTGAGTTFANAGLPLARAAALAPNIAGSAGAQLSGTGVMTGTRAREFRAALSGSGLMTVPGYKAGFSASLSGSGLATVARVLGIVTAGAGRGLVTTPQAWPGSSQVAVSPPGSSQKYWLSTLGIVTALQYSFTCPGGSDKLNTTVMVPASYRTNLFNPGWSVRVFRGGHSVWSGKLDEPQPTAQGWNLTATGTGNLGQDYLAIYSSSWPSNQPDESVNGAVGRGLPWANAGVGSPAGAWYGQGVDSGAQTITALLNLICTRGGLTWYVSSQPGGLPGDDLSVFPLPAAVNRLLIASSPVGRTLGGDTNVIWIRYQASADDTSAGGSAATYGTTSASNAQSVAMHGRIETYVDLSDAGVMSAGQAQQVGNYILQVYTRASFAGPFTVHNGDLTTTGGQPVDLGTDQAGTVCRLLLTDFALGGEVAAGPIQFITGSYAYDDFAQTAQISPLQTLDQSLSGLLGLESTLLQPITAASG